MGVCLAHLHALSFESGVDVDVAASATAAAVSSIRRALQCLYVDASVISSESVAELMKLGSADVANDSLLVQQLAAAGLLQRLASLLVDIWAYLAAAPTASLTWQLVIWCVRANEIEPRYRLLTPYTDIISEICAVIQLIFIAPALQSRRRSFFSSVCAGFRVRFGVPVLSL
jgi:hypothetical protein